MSVLSPANVQTGCKRSNNTLGSPWFSIKLNLFAFQGEEYLTHLVPPFTFLLLFAHLWAAAPLTQHSSLLLNLEESWASPASPCPHWAASRTWHYRLETNKENFQSSPRKSVPEKPVDNMSLICRT